MRTRFELADVVHRFALSLQDRGKLTPLQQKVLAKIALCRTAALGGHEEACDNCGTIRYSYNSCGDRHCPKCQAARQVNFYTHRVAITNQRIVNITDEKVTFIARDYRQGAAKKYITLGGVEFLRRFAQHILPRRFVKIRRYGIYNHTVKRNLGIKYQSLSLSGV